MHCYGRKDDEVRNGTATARVLLQTSLTWAGKCYIFYKSRSQKVMATITEHSHQYREVLIIILHIEVNIHCNCSHICLLCIQNVSIYCKHVLFLLLNVTYADLPVIIWLAMLARLTCLVLCICHLRRPESPAGAVMHSSCLC